MPGFSSLNTPREPCRVGRRQVNGTTMATLASASGGSSMLMSSSASGPSSARRVPAIPPRLVARASSPGSAATTGTRRASAGRAPAPAPACAARGNAGRWRPVAPLERPRPASTPVPRVSPRLYPRRGSPGRNRAHPRSPGDSVRKPSAPMRPRSAHPGTSPNLPDLPQSSCHYLGNLGCSDSSESIPDLSTITTDNICRYSDDGDVRWNILYHYGIRTDINIVTNHDVTEYFCSRPYHDIVSKDRSITGRRMTDCHLLIDPAIRSDLLCRYDSTKAMLNEEARSYIPSMKVKARHSPAKDGEQVPDTSDPEIKQISELWKKGHNPYEGVDPPQPRLRRST